jgi:UPF0755 protein
MKKILYVSLFVVFFLIISGLVFFWSYRGAIKGQVSESSLAKEFEIKSGEGAKLVAEKLRANGLISSPFFFQLYVWQTENGAKIQAGKYELSPAMSIIEMVEKFVVGAVLSSEHSIKMLEGWTIDDMDEYLTETGVAEPGEFARLAKVPVRDWSFSFAKPDFLAGEDKTDLEGYLFPDTYRIFKESTTEDIIKKMLDNFEQKLDQSLRAEIIRQNKSLHDIITMASIIEKEVNNEKDAALVAGILYKRLAIGMRLEVDSSVNYATGKSEASATYEDLQIDSPYNTYRNDGLPPGPIANPGLWAIKAAVYPEESPYLFYLNRQDTGETIFSKDFAEHVRNKNKYLK